MSDQDEGQHTGVDDPEQQQIQIDAPREPEVDPVHYRDVESLLFRGFIILPAEINGARFVFKSMNQHEFEYLQWVTHGATMDKYYDTFLAHGVFMVAGQNILVDRERWVPEVEKLFASLPAAAKSKLVRYMSDVNRKAANAITLTEVYQMERTSRFRWAQLKGLDVMSSTCTGIEGTAKLGLNYAQLVWRALNYYEDMREEAERDWDNAKFIGSCFAGKEIRKIYSQDKDRKEKEKNERIQRKDQLLRHVLLGEDLSKSPTENQYQIITARTNEELADQLQRDLRGEKDWHDEVVAREEARLKESEQAKHQQMRVMYETRVAENPNQTFGGSDASKGYSPAEVRERVIRQRQVEAQTNASRIVHDDRMANFLSKYGMTDETSDPLATVGVTDRDTSHAQPLLPPRPPGSPFRKG